LARTIFIFRSLFLPQSLQAGAEIISAILPPFELHEHFDNADSSLKRFMERVLCPVATAL